MSTATRSCTTLTAPTPSAVAVALADAAGLREALAVVLDALDAEAAYWAKEAGEEPATFDEVEADGRMSALQSAASMVRAALTAHPDPTED